MPVLGPEGVAEVGLVAGVVCKLVGDDGATGKTRDAGRRGVDLDFAEVGSQRHLVLGGEVSTGLVSREN